MSVFETLITDRTVQDVTNRTAKGCIAYTDLNRVETACRELADILLVDIATKTNWNIRDFRTDSDMQRIRSNIEKLRNAYFVKPTTPATPRRIEYQSISEANNIEQILADIYEMYESSLRGARRLAFRIGTRPIGDRR
nr:MAG TPA: hypothetical protein [Bacteriophage sp.]